MDESEAMVGAVHFRHNREDQMAARAMMVKPNKELAKLYKAEETVEREALQAREDMSREVVDLVDALNVVASEIDELHKSELVHVHTTMQSEINKLKDELETAKVRCHPEESEEVVLPCSMVHVTGTSPPSLISDPHLTLTMAICPALCPWRFLFSFGGDANQLAKRCQGDANQLAKRCQGGCSLSAPLTAPGDRCDIYIPPCHKSLCVAFHCPCRLRRRICDTMQR